MNTGYEKEQIDGLENFFAGFRLKLINNFFRSLLYFIFDIRNHSIIHRIGIDFYKINQDLIFLDPFDKSYYNLSIQNIQSCAWKSSDPQEVCIIIGKEGKFIPKLSFKPNIKCLKNKNVKWTKNRKYT